MRTKLTLIAALVALLSASCAEQSIESKTVTFTVGGVRTGAITKGGNTAIEAALAATSPTAYPTLTVQSPSVATRSYSVTPGTPVSLPLGEYVVTASYKPRRVGYVISNEMYDTPSYVINERITVTEGEDTYALTAVYDCFALVIDYTESEAYRHYGGQTVGWLDLDKFKRVGDIGVLYYDMSYAWGSTNYRIIVVPKDMAEHEETMYTLVTLDGYAGTKVEAGKWYCFSANAVTTQSGNLSIGFPEWIQGN